MSTIWQRLMQFASPARFYALSGPIATACGLAGAVLFAVSAYGGLVLAPADYQQGDAYRIIFVHVPAAWLSLLTYVGMAACAFALLVWRTKVAASLMIAGAVPGASFTALTLATGSLWGQPMWGAWWVWDARLTSELILLFLYLGFIALLESIPDRETGRRAGAVLLLAGTVNIPIIHYSVEWWNTLHQPATIAKFGAPSIATSMLIPLLGMALAFMLLAASFVLRRARADLLSQNKRAQWVQQEAAA